MASPKETAKPDNGQDDTIRPFYSRWWWGMTHLNYNVKLVLIFTVFNFIAISISLRSLFSVYIFLITDGVNRTVGAVNSVNGFVQLAAAVPAGILTDRLGRSHTLMISGLIGIVASGVSLYAFLHDNLISLYFVAGIWGAYASVSNAALESIFADSTPTGTRSFVFSVKYVLLQIAHSVGPAIALVFFVVNGDEWEVESLRWLLIGGICLFLIPLTILFFFKDKKTLGRVSEINLGANSVDAALKVPPLLFMTPQGSSLDSTSGDSSDRTDRTDMGVSLTDFSFDSPKLLHSESISLDTTTEEKNTSEVNSSDSDSEPDLESGSSEEDNKERIKEVNMARHPILSTLLCFFPCFSRSKNISYQLIPLFIILGDILQALGSGMSIKFFPVFLVADYNLSPMVISAVYVGIPLVVSAFAFAIQRISTYIGRVQSLIAARLLAITCMLVLAFAQPVQVEITMLVLLLGFLRCSKPLNRSILMDHVPKKHRGKFNAFKSVTRFSSASTALVGGIVADTLGYRVLFLITAGLFIIGLLPICGLLPLVPREFKRDVSRELYKFDKAEKRKKKLEKLARKQAKRSKTREV